MCFSGIFAIYAAVLNHTSQLEVAELYNNRL
jgi:hypothetical protein